MTKTDEICSEFSAPRIPFEEFVKRPEWLSLPLLIQLAVLHLRRAEHPAGELGREAFFPVNQNPPATEDAPPRLSQRPGRGEYRADASTDRHHAQV